jgi:hypothetical protein
LNKGFNLGKLGFIAQQTHMVRILYIALCIPPNKVFEAQKRPAEKPAFFLFIA